MKGPFIHQCYILLLVSLLMACDNTSKTSDKPVGGPLKENNADSVTDPTTGKDTKEKVTARSRQIVKLLKDKDFENLATLVHPVKGLRFSPYSFVNPDQDIHFSASQVQSLGASDTVYHWGSYDGTGEPIQKTFNGYYQEFIYDADFMNADLYFNKDVQRGNAINNARKIYGDTAKIVEFYVPGMETKYGGLDWRSLSLVFTPYQGNWYLEGIIHSEWTI